MPPKKNLKHVTMQTLGWRMVKGMCK